MIINEENYVDEAEKAVKNLISHFDRFTKEKVPNLTTTKIRSLLAMTADIYNDVMNATGDILDEDICARIEYLRVRFIYESGREGLVKDFVSKARLLEILQDIKKSKRNFICFSRYMEALVAYHKYYGGKEN
ncbi:MAG TPA: type III-A CRISPR-associated protein Csm2 [Lachnospiraceae bacterium]|nr:type III-A CRISPR-associated protein Csm2 [Lachnospiraceae bacterium]